MLGAGLAEQATSAFRASVVRQWEAYAADPVFARRLAQRLDYAQPYEFSTPPALTRLREAVVDVILEPLGADPSLRETALAAYALGGWKAALGVIPGADQVDRCLIRAFWPKALDDVAVPSGG